MPHNASRIGGFDSKNHAQRFKRFAAPVHDGVKDDVACPWVDPSLAAQQSAGGLVAILPFILIIIIFYVLMILPAQRRQKKLAAMIAALKNGDKVITNGGVYGTVVGLDAESVQLRIAEQVKVRVCAQRDCRAPARRTRRVSGPK